MIKILMENGDITKAEAEAIVNAANNGLHGGGGVDGAIHRAAGWDNLQDACRKIGYCETGEAVITPAFDITQVKHIIHTVGPICSEETKETQEATEAEKKALYSCYYNSLKLADEYSCKTVAFPSIATGIYGFPLKQAPKIFSQAVHDYEKENQNIVEIMMICFDEATETAYREVLNTTT